MQDSKTLAANLANGATRHCYCDVPRGDVGIARPGSGDGAAWWNLFPEAWMHAEVATRVPEVICIQNLAGANCGVLKPKIPGWYRNPCRSIRRLQPMRTTQIAR